MMIEMLIGTLGFSIFTFILGYALRSTQREEVFQLMDQYNRLQKDKELRNLKELVADLELEVTRLRKEKNGDERDKRTNGANL